MQCHPCCGETSGLAKERGARVPRVAASLGFASELGWAHFGAPHYMIKTWQPAKKISTASSTAISTPGAMCVLIWGAHAGGQGLADAGTPFQSWRPEPSFSRSLATSCIASLQIRRCCFLHGSRPLPQLRLALGVPRSGADLLTSDCQEQDSRRKAGGFSVHDDIMHLQELLALVGGSVV